jgi:hypothetical protein
VNFYLVPAAEITLFLLYKLIVDYQDGWFLHPSAVEGAILVSLVLLAVLFGWLGVGGSKKIPLLDNYSSPSPGKDLNSFWHTSFLFAIVVLLVFVILPVNKNEPYFIRLILKNRDLFGLMLLLWSEVYIYLRLANSRRTIKFLSVSWIFCYRNLLWIIFIILVSVKIIILVPITRGLLVMNDTYIYWVMANQIFHGVLNVNQFHHYPPLYPAILSPIFLLGIRDTLQHFTVLNSVISSTAIFPLYLLARQYLERKWSLIFIVLCAAFPFHIVYPEILFSENLFYPLFFWAVYFSLATPGNPRKIWLCDFLFAGTMAAMWLTRYMTLPLIPIFLLVWWIKPDQENVMIQIRPTRGKLIRLSVIAAVIVIAYALWFIPGISSGVGIRSMLGFDASGGGNTERLTLPLLGFWTGVSAGYLALILAPVLNILLISILSWKQMKWDGITMRWVIAVTTITAMLFVEVTRHAWQAVYNFPEPDKYVGRYVLYISALVWLTAIILLKNKINISRWKIFACGLLSAAIIFTGYQLFFDPVWIINHSIINFRFIDVYSITFLQWTYLLIIASLISGSSLLISFGKNQSTTILLCGGILCLNLIVWPGYIEKMKFYETPARHLDALLANLPLEEGASNSKSTLYVPPGSNFYEEELVIRGQDPSDYLIKQMFNDPLRSFKCKTRLMAKYADGQSVAVIDQSINCSLPEEFVKSTYMYNGKEYFVISIPPQ